MDKGPDPRELKQITREEYFKFKGMVCHAFSPDGNYIAISNKQDHDIEIYEITDYTDINKWKYLTSFKEQTQQISDLAWSYNNYLLSCSFDRSVLIYKKIGQEWDRDLVIIENKLAAIVGVWSLSSKKFAVGSGDHRIYIGYYEENMKWWNTQVIRSFKSSITSIAFHPSEQVIAAGSTDFSFKIISCNIEGLISDQKYPFSNIDHIGEVLFEIKDCGGWITSVDFNFLGTKFAFSVHDSTLHHGTIQQNQEITEKEKLNLVENLPIKKIIFKSDNEIIGGGFDLVPLIFMIQDDKISKYQYIEQCLSISSTGPQSNFQKQIQTMEQSSIKFSRAVTQIQNNILLGQKHDAPINCLRKYQNQEGKDYIFSTSDSKGLIKFWKV